MPLVDSQIIPYKIYILRNPINKEVFYVGQTLNSLAERLSGHIHYTESNKPKNEYIKKIIDEGFTPIIEEVETIHTTCYIDRMSVSQRELYWINYYKGIGCNLLNSATPRSIEYENYLMSLKSGESKWHYYYCGETISGKKVYNTERIEADGMKIPENYFWELKKSNNNNDYSPFKNERFWAKLGDLKHLDTRLRYIDCYRDNDPNYYDDDY